MKTRPFLFLAGVLPLAWHFLATASAEAPGKTLPLFDPTEAGVEKSFKPVFGADAQVSTAGSPDASAPGVVVTIAPGSVGYPGVDLKPASGATWNLSEYGHVEARIVNTSGKPLSIALRVDNAGDWHDSPWNTEQTKIMPGATGTIKVIFGYAYNQKPSYPLKTDAVVNIELFTMKASERESFRIESIAAGGTAGEKPPVDPRSVRTVPKDGVILGSGEPIDAKGIVAKGGAQATATGDGLEVTFPATGMGEQSVSLKPAIGYWDLREALEVRVKVKNGGQTPVTPSVQLGSTGGNTGAVAASAPLAPGAETEIDVPFAATVPSIAVTPTKPGYYDTVDGTGTKFCSDAAGPIKITASHQGEASLVVESITTDVPVAEVPDWLGKRPPVEGDWVKTFDDEFTGNAIDLTKWNIYGSNYWDKRTHWSKDDLLLGNGGGVTLHFEKKRGYQNDDPKERQTDFACGYLDTYGKWVQRYGYFEARLKLPDVPGLWPTFWLMPDRGEASGPQWKRQDTGNGGMEFDIMEHLTRWGPHRYNIAMHFDGYGKSHAATGSAFNYVAPDKDGFITVGLLWTPGSAIYYCNGKEVLRWETPRISNVQSNIIIEETTGGWDNDGVDVTKLPADYVVDYVRVWQRRDLASAVDGPVNQTAKTAAQ